MDATLEQYIHIGLGIIVATVTLVIIASCLHIRREAQIDLENRKFYEAQYNYKSKINGLVNGDLSVIETISLITQFAEDFDIYVDRLSGTYNGYSLLVNGTNRYNIEELNLTDAELTEQFRWTMASATNRAEAKKYGPISAATVGNVLYGLDRWELTIVYDGRDVTLVPDADNGKNRDAKITGLRLIKK